MTRPDPRTNSGRDLDSLRARLKTIHQDHLLRFYGDISGPQRQSLLEQIAALDLGSITILLRNYVLNQPATCLPADIKPAPCYRANPRHGGYGHALRYDPAACREAGDSHIRGDGIAAFTVAGGQGSRLGFNSPKGCYPAGAVTKRPIFQLFAEQIRASQERHRVAIPWYIMTSPLNHEATIAFFREHDSFGLDSANVMLFPQGVMPSFELGTGRILLAAKDQLATNPDGHGGAFKALYASGAVADMQRRGVEQISYFQVDNPIVRVIDPVFLGMHIGAGGSDSSGEMSSKMIPKAHPGEKLGVFCSIGGKTTVVEYSDLPERLATERLEDGSLRFFAGSIAVHILSVDFVSRLNTRADLQLPYHRAEKKIPHIDPETGALVKPEKDNGVKLERFVFDALPLCRRSAVLETDRTEEFAPIKNATGSDSPESCARIQTRRNARWLESVGVRIPRTATGDPDCTIEISPLTALEPADLKGKPLPKSIDPGARLAL